MAFALCNKSDGVVETWTLHQRNRDQWVVNPATHVVVEADLPGPRENFRWDGATGLRPATETEKESTKPQWQKDREDALLKIKAALALPGASSLDRAVWTLLVQMFD